MPAPRTTKPNGRRLTAGRPSKLTPAVQRKIIKVMRDGAYIQTAAAAARISVSTLNDWLAKGRAARLLLEEADAKGKTVELTEMQQECLTFVELMEEAEAIAENTLIARIYRASEGENGDWRAAAEILRRRHSERWEPARKIEADVTHFTPTDPTKLSDEELARTLADEGLL